MWTSPEAVGQKLERARGDAFHRGKDVLNPVVGLSRFLIEIALCEDSYAERPRCKRGLSSLGRREVRATRARFG
jgi:hypothetical protein